MDNAQKAIPEVSITLATKGRVTIRCSLGALCRYELKTGVDPMTVNWSKASPVQFMTFLWCALGGEKSGFTIEDLADELDLSSTPEIIEAIYTTISGAALTDEQKKILREGRRQKPTGSPTESPAE